MKLVKEISTEKYKVISDAELAANPSLYIDRSYSPTYWYKFHKEAGYSYWQSRYEVNQLVNSKLNGVNDFRDNEKEYLGLYGAGNNNDIITYYVTIKGLSLQDAQMLHISRLSENTANKSIDAREIIASPKMMQIGIKYLTWVDNTTGLLDSTQANNLTSAIQGFLTEFERYALLGLNYDDERIGLMDYLESTNSYASGGLKNYVFAPDLVTAYGTNDAVRLAMIIELQDLFIKGNI